MDFMLNSIIKVLANNSSWLQGLEALIVIFGLPIAIIKWIFYRPRLVLRFDPSETYHEVTDVSRNKKSFWLQVICINKGWVEAKDTNGYLIRVYDYDPKRRVYTYNSRFRSQLILKWSHEDDYGSQNILPRDKRRLDVCFIYEDDQSNLNIVTKIYASGTARVLQPGKFLLEIIVTGENVKRPARIPLHIEWDGTWKNLSGHKPAVRSFVLYRKIPIKSFKIY